MTFIIVCGNLYWSVTNKWTTDPAEAKRYEKRGPDWGLPFAPDERDDQEPEIKPTYHEIE